MRPGIGELICVLLLVSSPAAATTPVEEDLPPVGTSSAGVTVEQVSGLDALAVQAGYRYDRYRTHVTHAGSQACVTARRTDLLDGGARRLVHLERGCTDQTTTYRFDRTTGTRRPPRSLPTTVRTTSSELWPDGWQVVDVQETTAVAEVELTWVGTGDQRPGPWAQLPRPCYFFLLPLCSFGAGLTVSRDAAVSGSVVVGGLSAAVGLTDHPGGELHWRLSAYVVRAP